MADVFNPIIKDNWDFHLKRMVNFWSTILLYTKQYKDDPMPNYLQLAIKKPIPLCCLRDEMGRIVPMITSWK